MIVMRIVTGYLCLIGLLVLLFKFVARKWGNEKMNALFRRWHKPASGIFFLAAILHLILVIPVLKERPPLLWGTGAVSFFLGMLVILLGHTIKDKRKNMLWHRILSVILTGFVALHMVFFFI